MKARIGLLLFIVIFLITVAGVLMRQAAMNAFVLSSQSVLVTWSGSRALFKTLNWGKIVTNLAEWKSFRQKAS